MTQDELCRPQKTPGSVLELEKKLGKHIMKEHVNDNQIRDYDVVLDAKFGQAGSSERMVAEEEAYAFYSGQIIRDARKGEKVTQQELASRIGTTKSYISKIENGSMTPSVGTFYRIIGALGLRVEIVRPMATRAI